MKKKLTEVLMETNDDFAKTLDFIENLVLTEEDSIKSGNAPMPSPSGKKMAPAGIDISNVSVPDDLMTSILGKEYTSPLSDSSTPDGIFVVENTATDDNVMEKVRLVDPTLVEPTPMITEGTAQTLIPLLENLTNLIKEMTVAMTSSGSIGTNFAGPQKDIYKRPTTKKKSRKDILKDSIRSKLAK